MIKFSKKLWVAFSQARLVAGFFAIAAPAYAAPIVVAFPDGTDTLPIDQNFTWIEDSTHKLAPVAVKALFATGAFRSAAEASNVPYSSSRFWFRFELNNSTGLDELYVDALLPTGQDLEVYKESPHGGLEAQQILDRRYPLAKISIAPGETAAFIAGFRTYDTGIFPFTIKTAEGVARRDFEDTAFMSMFIGVTFALVLYNLFLFLSLKHREFLFYILFTVTNAFLALISVKFPSEINMLGGFDLYPWAPYWRTLGPLTTFLFAKAFLQSAKSYPKLNLLMNVYLGILLAAVAVLGIADRPDALAAFQDIYFLLGILILLGAGIYALRMGFQPAQYFLLGIGSFLVGIFVLLMVPALGMRANVLTLNAHIIAQAVEMILMSLALASFVKQLEQDKARSEATLQVKSRLLRIISHDIANPLSIIFGFGQMLSKKYPTDDHVSRILRSAEAIDKVAAYVRKTEATNGFEKTKLESVSLKKCFDELAFLFEHFAQEKGVTLTFAMSARDILVAAQEVCLRNEILGNLVSNAIKFSFVGSEVEIKAEIQGPKVRIVIKDRGIGMPKQVIASLFDPARNLSRQGTSGEIGNGYGMPIVYSFVKDYGGDIEVRSVSFDADRSNSGTEIILTLLRADVPNAHNPISRRPPLFRKSPDRL